MRRGGSILGGSYDISQLLRRKYDNMENSTAAQTTAADASMMGARTERMGMPSVIAGREAMTAGQLINNRFAPDVFEAGIRNTDANTNLTDEQRRTAELDNRLVGGDLDITGPRHSWSVGSKGPRPSTTVGGLGTNLGAPNPKRVVNPYAFGATDERRRTPGILGFGMR